MTEESYSAGDEVRINGHAWIVEDVLVPGQSGGYTMVRLKDRAGAS